MPRATKPDPSLGELALRSRNGKSDPGIEDQTWSEIRKGRRIRWGYWEFSPIALEEVWHAGTLLRVRFL